MWWCFRKDPYIYVSRKTPSLNSPRMLSPPGTVCTNTHQCWTLYTLISLSSSSAKGQVVVWYCNFPPVCGQTNKHKPHNEKEQGVMGKFHSRFQEVATFPSFSFLRKIESVEGEQISFHKGFRQLQTAKMTKNWNNYRKVGNSEPVCTTCQVWNIWRFSRDEFTAIQLTD